MAQSNFVPEKTMNDSNCEIPFFTFKQLSCLKIGSGLDHRDYVGKFCHARIINKLHNKIKIHYHKFSKKYDIWDDFTDPHDIQKHSKNHF